MTDDSSVQNEPRIATYEVPAHVVQTMWLRHTGNPFKQVGYENFVEAFKLGWLISRNLDPDYHRVVLV